MHFQLPPSLPRLSITQSPILQRKLIAPHGHIRPKHMPRIIPVLQAQQALVIHAVVILLPKRVRIRPLARIRPAPRRDIAHQHVPIVQHALATRQLRRRIRDGEADAERHVKQRVAPGGDNGVRAGLVAHALVRDVVGDDGDEAQVAAARVVDDGAEGVDQCGERVRDDVARHEAAADGDVGVEVLVPVEVEVHVAEAGLLHRAVGEQGDVQRGELRVQRRHGGVDVRDRGAGDGGEEQGGGCAGDVPVGAEVGDLVEDEEVRQPGADAGPVRVVVLVEEGEGRAGGRAVAVPADRDADRHAEVARPAAREAPVQIGVLGRRGGADGAVRRHHFELQHVVGAQAERRTEGPVPTALGPAACRADGGAPPAHGHEAVGARRLVQLAELDAGTELNGRAGVRGAAIIGEADVFEVVRPETERALARRAAEVVVARVFYC